MPDGTTSEEDKLRAEVTRLNKIIEALISRAERSASAQGSDFNLFETAIRLEEQVNRRTEELEAALRENEKINRALQQAKSGMEREIAERARIQRQLAIQYAVSRVLAESSSVAEAAPRVLEVIASSSGWDVANLWSVDHQAGVLRCVQTWAGAEAEFDEFKAVSRATPQPRGIGLSGRVWVAAEPMWIPDVVEDPGFIHAAPAKRAGLRSACLFPIPIESGVGAIIELFSLQRREPDADLLQLFTVLGSQLGQFVQRRRLEEHLIKSQKLETVGKLAGGIAHEFNSIMTAIIGQSEMLLGGLSAESSLAHGAAAIRKAADRAAALTRQLLAFGRKQILQPEALDLNHIVARMEGMLRHLMGEHVEMRIIPFPDLPAVKADAGQIEQVIVNLAINAREAMPDGGRLTVEAAQVTIDTEGARDSTELKPGHYVTLAITDTSVGMNAETCAHVFEPFFSTKSIGHGASLGMATCYGIVKQSGGHISVFSEPGCGTSFKIYLPQVPRETAMQPQPHTPLESPRGNETILLVEGDPALREMAASLLMRLGYDVLAAADSSEALALTERRGQQRIDLLFIDVATPGAKGEDLSARIAALHPEMKTLFASACTDNAIAQQSVSNPGTFFLPKPFTPSALAKKIRQTLEMR